MTTLEIQHATAYEILGTLISNGYTAAKMELGGGGIAEVTAPLPDNKLTGYPQRLAFASYVEDSLFIEQHNGEEWLFVWELPSRLIDTTRPIWLQVVSYLEEIKEQL